MTRLLPCFILLAIVFASTSLRAQTDADNHYDSLVTRLRKGDTTVDYRELRIAFSRTSRFSPYDDHDELRKKMMKHFGKNQYDSAIYYANLIMDVDYPNILAHSIAATSYREQGNQEQAAIHHAIMHGLIESILNSGDGRTAATAFVVIAVREEYTILGVFDLRASGQALDNSSGHPCDKFTVTDDDKPDQKPMSIYFNVEIPMSHLSKLLDGK